MCESAWGTQGCGQHSTPVWSRTMPRRRICVVPARLCAAAAGGLCGVPRRHAFQAVLPSPRKCARGPVEHRHRALEDAPNIEMAKESFRQSLRSPSGPAQGLRCLSRRLRCSSRIYEQALTLRKQLLELGEPTSDWCFTTWRCCRKRGAGAPPDAVRYYRQALAISLAFPRPCFNPGPSP